MSIEYKSFKSFNFSKENLLHYLLTFNWSKLSGETIIMHISTNYVSISISNEFLSIFKFKFKF